MTRALPLLGVLALAVSVGCGASADGPPAIQVDRTACAHCGMLVSEPAYAAAYRASGGTPLVFDDIGCLLESVRTEPRADAIVFWFRDAAGGSWIDSDEAVFVRSRELPTPMGGGVIAYRDETLARQAAEQHRGEMVRSLDALRQGLASTHRENGP